MKVVGTIMSTGEIVIDGHLEGNIYGVRVTIGDNGFVQGDVIASEIMASGRVAGNLRATTVRLHAHGAIEGDIDYQTLSVAMGASLNGDCRHSDNPLAGIAEHAPENATQSPSYVPPQPGQPLPRQIPTPRTG